MKTGNRVRRFWDKRFRGYQGYTGAKGDKGEDGHLQLSGFPSGTQICLYDHNGNLMWYGRLKKVNL